MFHRSWEDFRFSTQAALYHQVSDQSIRYQLQRSGIGGPALTTAQARRLARPQRVLLAEAAWLIINNAPKSLAICICPLCHKWRVI